MEYKLPRKKCKLEFESTETCPCSNCLQYRHDNEIYELGKRHTQKTIHIEIRKGYVTDSFCIRIGDIVGAIESFNITNKEVINEIQSELNKLKGEKND